FAPPEAPADDAEGQQRTEQGGQRRGEERDLDAAQSGVDPNRIIEIGPVPAQRQPGWRKAQIRRRAEGDWEYNEQWKHQEYKGRAGMDAQRHCPTRDASSVGRTWDQAVLLQPVRFRAKKARSAAESNRMESAEANPQSRNWRTCCSISTAIMMTRPPPSSAGVM